MEWNRFFRHLFATHATLRRAFPPATLSAIEAAVAESEQHHSGEIRVAVEAGLEPLQALRGRRPRDRALEVFGRLGVWDTEANSGVLVYLLLADRDVEIVADRGYEGRVSSAEWQAVCHAMESRFRSGDFRRGMLDGVRRVGELVSVHFPAGAQARNPDELPNRPTLL